MQIHFFSFSDFFPYIFIYRRVNHWEKNVSWCETALTLSLLVSRMILFKSLSRSCVRQLEAPSSDFHSGSPLPLLRYSRNCHHRASCESFGPGDIREIGDDSTRRSMTGAARGKVNSFIQKTIENSRDAAASRGFRDSSNFPGTDAKVRYRCSRRTRSRATEIFIHALVYTTGNVLECTFEREKNGGGLLIYSEGLQRLIQFDQYNIVERE